MGNSVTKKQRRRATDLSTEQRYRKQLSLGLVTLLLGLVATAATFVVIQQRRAVEKAFPQVSGVLEVPKPTDSELTLSREVKVHRDGRGVPHIVAEIEADAYWTLGFVHAQDRLGQMIWFRASARGQAAEWVGPSAFEADREARIIGIGVHADKQAEKLDRGTSRLLRAYSAGVNARMKRIEDGLVSMPRGLEGMDVPLAPWSPADTLAIAKLYAWGLGTSLESTLVLSDLISKLGGPEAVPFFPRGAQCDGKVSPSQVWRSPLDDQPLASEFQESLRGSIGLEGQAVGSSAWVVGGQLSASRKPLLAADSHAETTAPGLYYQAHLRGGALNVAGATIPGVPVVWTGQNPHLAWAATHAPAVVADLFVERLRPDSPNRYHDGIRWEMTEQREEVIHIRGQAPKRIVVRETRNGPLINELLGEGRPPLSIAWSGAMRGDGLASLLKVMRAQSAKEFRARLRNHHEPVMAFVFADSEGAGGMQVAGWIPNRNSCAGLVPIEGRLLEARWTSRIPFSMLPSLELDDETAQVVVADNRLPSAAEIEWLWTPGERATRISELLDSASLRDDPLTVRTLTQMQSDNVRPRAVSLLRDSLVYSSESRGRSPGAKKVMQLLEEWNGETDADSKGAAVYHVFVDRLFRALFKDALGEELLERYLGLARSDPEQVIRVALNDAALNHEEGSGERVFPWATKEAITRAVDNSLEDAWVWLSVSVDSSMDQWLWGQLHALQFRPLWPKKELRSDNLGPFPLGGSRGTIASGEFDPANPFAVKVASTFRFIVDTYRLDESLTSSVPGQSEHLRHPHRADQVQRWLEVRPALLSISALSVEETAGSTLRIVPGS